MANAMDVDCSDEMKLQVKKDSEESDSGNENGSPNGGSTVTDCDNPERKKTEAQPPLSLKSCAVKKEQTLSSSDEDSLLDLQLVQLTKASVAPKAKASTLRKDSGGGDQGNRPTKTPVATLIGPSKPAHGESILKVQASTFRKDNGGGQGNCPSKTPVATGPSKPAHGESILKVQASTLRKDNGGDQGNCPSKTPVATGPSKPAHGESILKVQEPSSGKSAVLYGAPKILGTGTVVGLNFSSSADGPHITLPSGVKVPVSITPDPTTGLLQINTAPSISTKQFLPSQPVVKLESSGPGVKPGAGQLPATPGVRPTAVVSGSAIGKLPVTKGVIPGGIGFTLLPQSGKLATEASITSGEHVPKGTVKDVQKPSRMQPNSKLPNPPTPVSSEKEPDWESGMKMCIMCGYEKHKYSAEPKKYTSRLNAKSRADNLEATNLEVLTELFPSVVKSVDHDLVSTGCWVICERCGLDVGQLFKNLLKADTLKSSIVKKMEAAFPGRDSSSTIVTRTVKMIPRPKHPLKSDKHVETAAVSSLSKRTQTMLSVCNSDAQVPPGIMMTAMEVTDQSGKSIELSAQEFCINDSKERGYSVRVHKPQHDVDDDHTYDGEQPHVKKQDANPRELVLIQVPRGPVSSVGVQTYQTKSVGKNVLQSGNLGSVSIERGTDEENMIDNEMDKEEIPVFIRGQCAVCGAIPEPQQPFQYLHTQRTSIRHLLLKFCGTFLLDNRTTCICHDCKKHVLGFETGIKQLKELCKRNVPSFRNMGQNQMKRKQGYIISERASDIVTDQQDELQTEHRYATTSSDKAPTSRKSGKRRKVMLPGIDLATNSAGLKSVVASRALKRENVLKAMQSRAKERAILPKPSNHMMPTITPVVDIGTNPFPSATVHVANDLILPIEIPWNDEQEVAGSDDILGLDELPSLPYIAK